MNSFEENLEKYADLAVRVGINVQPDQTLLIDSPITAERSLKRHTKQGQGMFTFFGG